MSDTLQQEQSDANVEEGYYCDGYGNVAKVTVEEEQAECRNIDTETNEPYYTFNAGEDPADHGYDKVADIAVQNPLRVAQEVYNHGYGRDAELFVAGERCGAAEFEFVDTVTEISLRDEFEHLGSGE